MGLDSCMDDGGGGGRLFSNRSAFACIGAALGPPSRLSHDAVQKGIPVRAVLVVDTNRSSIQIRSAEQHMY